MPGAEVGECRGEAVDVPGARLRDEVDAARRSDDAVGRDGEAADDHVGDVIRVERATICSGANGVVFVWEALAVGEPHGCPAGLDRERDPLRWR